MSPLRSLLDTLLVARFELLRAVRTWRALAMILLYVIASAGGAWVFIEILAEMENAIADQLMVPHTRWPGGMTDQLRNSENLLKMLEFLVGDASTVQALADVPLLAIWQLWEGLILVPFLAATAAAEAVAVDVASRALRFELLRTGRPELVAGRFLGQTVLSVVATLASLVVVWAMGMSLMVEQDPVALARGLLEMGTRAIVFSLPFAGLGIAASCLTASSNWARVLALAGTAGSWVVYGYLVTRTTGVAASIADGVLPLLPQAWLGDLWRPGGGVVLATFVCVALAMTAVGVGTWRLMRRDL